MNIVRIAVAKLFISLLLLTLCSNVFAQEDASEELAEITITADPFTSSLSDYGSAISVLTKDDLNLKVVIVADLSL